MTKNNFTPPTSPKKAQKIHHGMSTSRSRTLPPIFKGKVLTDIQRLKNVQNFERVLKVKVKEYEAREKMIEETEILLMEREKVLERRAKVLAAKNEMLIIKETRIIYDEQNRHDINNILNH